MPAAVEEPENKEGAALWEPDWEDDGGKEDFLQKLKRELGASMKE